MSLDDAEGIRKIDRSDMLSIMEMTPTRLAPPVNASSTCSPDPGTVDNVVFGGVGGSGIVGDIISDYCRGRTTVPLSVCRAFRIPAFVGKHTLFVAVSYSGNTRETLGQVEQAKRRDAKIIAICSGGNLLSIAKSESIPYLKVPSGLLPRVALPELVAAAVFAIGSARLSPDWTRALSEPSRLLSDLIKRVKPSVPTRQNSAKRMARALPNKLPLIICDEAYGSVLRRFKNELNENSKMPALCYTVPEGYHDDIEGLAALRQLTKPQPLLFRTRHELDGQRRTREQLTRLLSDLHFPPVLEFYGKGTSVLSQLLTAVAFAGYVSVYLAILRGVDPAELKVIPKFRQAMQS